MAAVEVDDGKPAVPEAHPPVHVNALVVRPAVAQRVGHRPDLRRAHRLGLNNPTDPAHSVSFIGRAGRSATAPAKISILAWSRFQSRAAGRRLGLRYAVP